MADTIKYEVARHKGVWYVHDVTHDRWLSEKGQGYVTRREANTYCQTLRGKERSKAVEKKRSST